MIFAKPSISPGNVSLTRYAYTDEVHQALIKQPAYEGAAYYNLEYSTDGGATWTTYRSGLTTPEVLVSGLYTGKTYGFRVIGLSSSQTTLATFQTTFSPSTNASSLIDEAFADFFEEELTF